MKKLGRVLIAALLVAVHLLTLSSAPARAVGGPVILGGDDLTDHGFFSGGVNQGGWLYLQRALENIKPNVTRPNDNSVAALGSASSLSTAGDAGGAIGRAAAAAGLTVDYRDGAPAIEAFFNELRAGKARPAIIWIAGDGANNDLDNSEGLALVNNAATIASFVSEGGGLLSHGSDYRWLSALLPGSSAPFSGDSNDLVLTAQGQAAFPGLTNGDINAGPWHNHFEGNLGGLQVLALSTAVNTSTGADAPVIIGGAVVTIAPVGGCPPDKPTIVGTAGPDRLLGTPGPDVIHGLGGNDQIAGMGGNDIICGGDGNDEVYGGDGNDRVYGDKGDDRLSGDGGNDTLNDTIGSDKMSGGEGDDTLQTGDGTAGDQLVGGNGRDTCTTDSGDFKSACEA